MARNIARANQNGLVKKSVWKNDLPFRITVTGRRTVVETGDIYLRVEAHPPDGRIVSYWLLRSEVIGGNPKKLINLGADIPSDKEGKKRFEQYIQDIELNLPSTFNHTGIGWANSDEEPATPDIGLYFKGYNGIRVFWLF